MVEHTVTVAVAVSLSLSPSFSEERATRPAQPSPTHVQVSCVGWMAARQSNMTDRHTPLISISPSVRAPQHCSPLLRTYLDSMQ